MAANPARRISLETFLTYGLVESIFVVAVPALTVPANVVRDHSWISDAVLFALCCVLGLAVGAIVEACVARASLQDGKDRETLAYWLSVLGLSGVLAAWWLSAPIPSAGWASAALRSVPIVFAAFIALAWPLRRRIPFLRELIGSPLWAAVALFGGPWLITEGLDDQPYSIRFGVAIAGVAGLAFATVAFRRRGFGRSFDTMRGRLAAIVGLWAALGLADAFLFQQQPLRGRPTVAGGPASSASPHIVLITMDTVRADHTSLYGYERTTTPRLDELARTEATLYRGAFSAGDVTLSTHASLFTGLSPGRHGAVYDRARPAGRPLGRGYETLAETLRNLGYRTRAVVANTGFLSAAFGFAQGFEVYDHRRPRVLFERAPHYSLREAVRVWFAEPLLGRAPVYRSAEEINQEALRAFDDASGSPLFLFLNYMEAHAPYEPPPPCRNLFPGRDPAVGLDGSFYAVWAQVLRDGRRLTERERSHLVSQYDGSIACLDSALGDLFDALRARGVWERSLVIVTSDHGEAFGEHQLMGHGVSAFQDQVRVPLLIKWPGDSPARTSSVPVGTVDVYATALRVAGVPTDSEGEDLAAVESDVERIVFSESRPSGSLRRWNPTLYQGPQLAASGRDYRLVRTSDGRELLFDRRTDPMEAAPLEGKNKIRRALSAALSEWDADTHARDAADSEDGVGRHALEQLRSLGYIQ